MCCVGGGWWVTARRCCTAVRRVTHIISRLRPHQGHLVVAAAEQSPDRVQFPLEKRGRRSEVDWFSWQLDTSAHKQIWCSFTSFLPVMICYERADQKRKLQFLKTLKGFQVGTVRTPNFRLESTFSPPWQMFGQYLILNHFLVFISHFWKIAAKTDNTSIYRLQELCEARAATQSCTVSGAIRCLCQIDRDFPCGAHRLVFTTNTSKSGLNWTQPWNKTGPLLGFSQ